MGFGNPMAVRAMQLYKGTVAEQALEDAVAELGVPYRIQFPGYMYGTRFFPDFLLPTLKLIIEVDDDSHDRADKIEADRERTATLMREWGCQVVRCTNEEAVADPSGTVRRLLTSAGLWPLPSRRPTLRQALPVLRKAPQKIKREAVAAAKRAARTSKPKSAGRRAPSRKARGTSDRQSPKSEAPPPPQAPLQSPAAS